MPAPGEFKQTRDEQTLWSTCEAWNRLVEGWKDEPAGAAPHDPKTRPQQWAGSCRSTPGLPTLPRSPFTKSTSRRSIVEAPGR